MSTAADTPAPPSAEELAGFAAAARAFIAEHGHAAPPDYGAIIPNEIVADAVAWQQRLFEHGWAGIDWPERFGGRGLTPQHRATWVRECALAGVPAFINMVGVVLAGGSTQLFGTEEQQAEHLRSIISAERLWCQLFSEPGAGSDLASLATKAVRDGDHFVVTGQKVWCSGGRYSDWGILLARTDPDAPKHKGISFFLVDMSLPGIEVRPLRQMTGEAEFDEVFFDEVRVPADCLLGPLHGGWMVAMATLTNERGSIGSAPIAMTRRLDMLMAELRAAGELGGVQRDEVAALVGQVRVLTMLGARQGPQASTASSLLKLAATELGFTTAQVRTQLSGAEAMLADDDATKALLAAPGGRIAGGSSQVQRNLIGERLLGLPGEPGRS